ncbi:MAG: TRAP transporter fused permease subunit [Rhizobiaceae bacterium]|nr:TRAP transporter fused permease subunit [Rhizobiaceae bacterium]MCV0407109.1 TRAP transporter fused permease subunit [Rhizobiaceae bacterium]
MTGTAIKAFAACTAVWTVYAAAFSRTDTLSLTITFLSLMLVLTFLLVGPSERSDTRRVSLPDVLLACLSAAAGIYFLNMSDEISRRITLLDPLSTWDIGMSTLMLLLTLEAMRRTVGLGLTLIVLLFLAYNLFGHLLTGVFGHGEITYTHFIDITFFTTDALFGVPLRVAATYAFLFVLFGTALSKAGGSQFFYNVSALLTGGTPGGPAKIAVISSGLYGTISGSPTSDVVTTGSVTIPMMKRMGYNSVYAGAVEVAASSGGSLLPPVMGAAAFIMAEYTGVPYPEIALSALIPALLFYVPIYAQVHLRARRYNLAGVAKDQIPTLAATMRDGGLFIVPLLVITWALVQGYTPTYTAVYGLAAIFIVSLLRKSTRLGPAAIFDILATASIRTVAVAGACAAAGLVIGGITMTGLASKFGALVFLIAGSDMFISLVVAGALTLLLGMGMPTPSAYILAAVLVSPVMRALDIDTVAGHLFLLYFAVMSALTPPVAVAAYAASAIANENPLKIAAQSVKIAIGAFLIPFAFVFNHELLMRGSPFAIAYATASCFAGLLVIAIAAEGFYRERLAAVPRLLLLAAGILLLWIDYWLLPVALVLIAAAWLYARLVGARSGEEKKAAAE